MKQVDILAIAAHPDDIELLCGGTLIRAQMLGRTTGILDLAAGELASRGTPELRAKEAGKAGKVMGVSVRENSGCTTAAFRISQRRGQSRGGDKKTQEADRDHPLTAWRHPDHPVVAQLVRDACFVAGLKKVEPKIAPHRPRKVLHALSFREDNQKPTFVVDISDALEKKLEAIGCYESQFGEAVQAGEVYPNGEPLHELIRHHAAHYGSLIRCRYATLLHHRDHARRRRRVARGVDVLTEKGRKAHRCHPRKKPRTVRSPILLPRSGRAAAAPAPALETGASGRAPLHHRPSASELWFKLILHELAGLIALLESKDTLGALTSVRRVNALVNIVTASYPRSRLFHPSDLRSSGVISALRADLRASSSARSRRCRECAASISCRCCGSMAKLRHW